MDTTTTTNLFGKVHLWISYILSDNLDENSKMGTICSVVPSEELNISFEQAPIGYAHEMHINITRQNIDQTPVGKYPIITIDFGISNDSTFMSGIYWNYRVISTGNVLSATHMELTLGPHIEPKEYLIPNFNPNDWTLTIKYNKFKDVDGNLFAVFDKVAILFTKIK